MSGRTEPRPNIEMLKRPRFNFEKPIHSPIKTRVSACGKAIIIGEHAVVYGAEAVAMPVLNHRISLEIEPTPQKKGFQMNLSGQKVSNHLVKMIDDAFDALKCPPFSLQVHGSSKVLIGAGMGSSAALSVAMLRGISQSMGWSLSESELSHLGNMMERRFHGNPSGLDTAVVAYEQVISFRRGQGAQATEVSLIKKNSKRYPWRFVIIDSGVRSSTISMIKKAEPYFKGPEGPSHIKEFDLLAEEVKQGLARGDSDLVARAMNRAGEKLDAAGVVTDQLRDMMNAAREAGALAAKPTGAGGGGCVLTLLDSENNENQMTELKKIFGQHNVYEVSIP